MKPFDEFSSFLQRLGLAQGQHVVVHSSFRRVRSAFPGLRIDDVILALQGIVTPQGSIVIPTFTYCFKRTDGNSHPFVRNQTPSIVGSVSEFFRLMPGVVRTSSPTHSFGLWGEAASEISADNSPLSPLGDGSVLDWVANRSGSSVLMLGTDFSSLSLGHYIEIKAPVPWVNYSPWPQGDYLNVGVGETAEIALRDVPRCSKQFVVFEKDLVDRGALTLENHEGLISCLAPVELLLNEGVRFFRQYSERLLCARTTCDLCDARREEYFRP